MVSLYAKVSLHMQNGNTHIPIRVCILPSFDHPRHMSLLHIITTLFLKPGTHTHMHANAHTELYLIMTSKTMATDFTLKKF